MLLPPYSSSSKFACTGTCASAGASDSGPSPSQAPSHSVQAPVSYSVRTVTDPCHCGRRGHTLCTEHCGFRTPPCRSTAADCAQTQIMSLPPHWQSQALQRLTLLSGSRRLPCGQMPVPAGPLRRQCRHTRALSKLLYVYEPASELFRCASRAVVTQSHSHTVRTDVVNFRHTLCIMMPGPYSVRFRLPCPGRSVRRSLSHCRHTPWQPDSESRCRCRHCLCSGLRSGVSDRPGAYPGGCYSLPPPVRAA
jgi:hypothetical protein